MVVNYIRLGLVALFSYELIRSVAQGSMAHRHTAPEISGAVCDGKSRVVPNECSGVSGIRTKESLLEALKVFFKDNPGWQ